MIPLLLLRIELRAAVRQTFLLDNPLSDVALFRRSHPRWYAIYLGFKENLLWLQNFPSVAHAELLPTHV